MRGLNGDVDLQPFLLLLISVVVLTATYDQRAEADPIQIPDLTKCALATDRSLAGPVITLEFNCCLAVPATIRDFAFENYKPVRKLIRRPAQRASEKYIAKYNKAYALMKALPDTDPRSFKKQSDLHCAFCNGAYNQTGASGVPLQVHFSWLFLTWHRLYLYFHERILGSLIGDPGFSLVYWNWDDQLTGGNVMPEMFTRNGTAIYDEKRNQLNLPPVLVRLSAALNTTNNSVVVNENLNAMYQSIVTASTAELFMGGPYRTGTNLRNSTVISAPFGGSVENGVHNGIHFWTGDPNQPLRQNMGTFTTASRDPIFFAHHSNVDRLWDVWRYHLPGGEREDHTDTDFLDAEFLFYDEHANLVKVKARDALDNTKFGVSYKKAKSDDAWIYFSPVPVSNGSAVPAARASGVPVIAASPTNGTIQLGTRLVGIVQRPTGIKPTKAEEVLTIQGIQLARDNFVVLAVFVNLPGALANTSTASAEFLGSNTIVPTASPHRQLLINQKLEIGDNIRRVGIDNEREVVITVVVRGNVTVSIEGMQITYE